MAPTEKLTEEILKVLEENPREFTVSQVAEKLGVKRIDAHYTIKTLIDLKQVVPTRRSGNAQMYCLKKYENEFKGEKNT